MPSKTGLPVRVDKLEIPVNAQEVDTLRERVLLERIRVLQAKFDVVLEQRNGFARNYHEVCKIPFQERREILEDCDTEIERAGAPKTPERSY